MVSYASKSEQAVDLDDECPVLELGETSDPLTPSQQVILFTLFHHVPTINIILLLLHIVVHRLLHVSWYFVYSVTPV